MAKIYGLFGSMTGKLADTVMAVRNGEQIARKYQPVVYNPSTPAQIAQRAKMKLMSQLSAVMASVIAIPRVGSVSSRNLFTKKNFRNTSYSTGTNEASITLANVQLTEGIIPLGQFNTAARGENVVNASLVRELLPGDISRVVYALFAKADDGSLEFRGSAVSTDAGDSGGAYPVTLPEESRAFVVYAYGLRDNTEAARTVFGDLQVLTAETVAKVVTTSVLTATDITMTKTIGLEVAAAGN